MVVILVDDLGWRDLGCMGQTIARTPPIDRLAVEGLRFTPADAAERLEQRHRRRAARRAARGTAVAPRRKPHPRRRYCFWAELRQRVLLNDGLACSCGGRRRLLVSLTDPEVIGRILRHLGLPAEPPALAPPRPAGSRSVEFWRE